MITTISVVDSVITTPSVEDSDNFMITTTSGKQVYLFQVDIC
jgi:hypothetical protein